jgi:nitrogen fixation/metabolism regulation signal transduction histidine kinase
VLVSDRLAGRTEIVPVANSTLFLFLNALNVILIVLLFFLIARNLVKLVFERRRGILGAHLSLKFVLAFALTAAVPTAVLFLVAAFFITSSINTYFSLGVHGALERSREVAEAHYEDAARDMLWFGRHIADAITAERLLREENRDALTELVQSKQARAEQAARVQPRRRRGVQRDRRGAGDGRQPGDSRRHLRAAGQRFRELGIGRRAGLPRGQRG